MKRHLVALGFFAVGLIALIAVPWAVAQSTPNYMLPGGASWVIGNGGTLTVTYVVLGDN